jgi:hypothetical protein
MRAPAIRFQTLIRSAHADAEPQQPTRAAHTKRDPPRGLLSVSLGRCRDQRGYYDAGGPPGDRDVERGGVSQRVNCWQFGRDALFGAARIATPTS